ncbi:unnamed protein product, partial [Hymenolepis diminuta]
AISVLVIAANALTLQEATNLSYPGIPIYRRTSFNKGFHAVMACGVVFGSLTTLITMISIVVKQLVRLGWVERRKRT